MKMSPCFTVLLLSVAKAALSAPTSCPAHLPKAEAGHRVVSSCDNVGQKS